MKRQNAVFGKKSQFKIQQMTFMIAAVILFFALAGLFYLSFQYRTIIRQATELESNKAVLIADFVSGTTEFSCSKEKGSNCIDEDRLLILGNKTFYRQLWPISYIKVFVLNGNKEECTKINYPNCGYFNVYLNKQTNKTSSGSSFVALCRHEDTGEKCELGKIIVGYEIK